MLVHQANGTVAFNGSRVCLYRTECDIRKRAFSGAVLADDGMNLTGVEVEVDAVYGDDAWIALADPAQTKRAALSAQMLTRLKFARSSRVLGGLILPAMMAFLMASRRLVISGVTTSLVY